MKQVNITERSREFIYSWKESNDGRGTTIQSLGQKEQQIPE